MSARPDRNISNFFEKNSNPANLVRRLQLFSKQFWLAYHAGDRQSESYWRNQIHQLENELLESIRQDRLSRVIITQEGWLR